MKKYDIVNWCGVGQRLEELGFERVDGSINYKAPEDSVMSKFSFWQMVEFIYEAKLNVMVLHAWSEDGNDSICVDDRKFQQR